VGFCQLYSIIAFWGGRKRKSQQETKNVLYVRIKEKSQNLLQIGILRNCRRQEGKKKWEQKERTKNKHENVASKFLYFFFGSILQ